MSAEFGLVDLIRAHGAVERADVRLGIGDDAAVLSPPTGHELVACTDTLVAGVHFPPATAAADIGWKALAVNLSDLAAMGASPAWALLALTLPDGDRDFVAGFIAGFAELAERHRIALVGGDIARGPLAVNVTVHGFVPAGGALRRAAARPGDAVFVTGTLGDAAAGLQLVARSGRETTPSTGASDARERLLARLHRPMPRIAAGLALRDVANACIDVSDGLVADLGHVAATSGVGIEIDAERLPASSALLALFDADARRQFQLAGGDDYELAFTVPESKADAVGRDLARIDGGATRIGRVVAGEGVRVFDAGRREIAVDRRGWEHFA